MSLQCLIKVGLDMPQDPRTAHALVIAYRLLSKMNEFRVSVPMLGEGYWEIQGDDWEEIVRYREKLFTLTRLILSKSTITVSLLGHDVVFDCSNFQEVVETILSYKLETVKLALPSAI
jgi:hypothetical protein